jgi:transcriptional regulator with XRE-family HTH domain
MTRNDQLRAARAAKGLTQAELGKRLGGLPQSSIARLELGKHEPSVRTALLIARELDTTVEALFECVPPEQRRDGTAQTARPMTTSGGNPDAATEV